MLTNLRAFSFAAVVFRLLLAGLFGGTLGYNRAKKRRPAGFRTYIIVCTAAALTMLLGQYEAAMLAGPWAALAQQVGVQTDVSRFGAQVINGIGFLGAGTILVTDRLTAKGLTTAAGLWASACMGLAIGAGFYEGGLLVTALILLTELFLSQIEYRVLERAPEINLYVTYTDRACLESLLQFYRNHDILLLDMELTREKEGEATGALFSLRLRPPYDRALLLRQLQDLAGVLQLEEL